MRIKLLESFEKLPEGKILDFENNIQVEKKLKSYKKDLNDQFKDKIKELKNLTLDQEKFNSLISQLIEKMRLDENIEEQEKTDDNDNKDDKQPRPENQDQKTKDKEENHEEMSIDAGIPDLQK